MSNEIVHYAFNLVPVVWVIVALVEQADLSSLSQEGWSDIVSSQFRDRVYPAFHSLQSAGRYHSLKSCAASKGIAANNLHRLRKNHPGQRSAILKSTGSNLGHPAADLNLFKIAFITPCTSLDDGALKQDEVACAVNHCGIHKVSVAIDFKCHNIKMF